MVSLLACCGPLPSGERRPLLVCHARTGRKRHKHTAYYTLEWACVSIGVGEFQEGKQKIPGKTLHESNILPGKSFRGVGKSGFLFPLGPKFFFFGLDHRLALLYRQTKFFFPGVYICTGLELSLLQIGFQLGAGSTGFFQRLAVIQLGLCY